MDMIRLIPVLLLLALPAQDEPVRFGDAKQPQVAVDSRGNVYVAMLRGGNVVVAVSTDGGKSFGEPVTAIDAKGKARGGMRRGPRIGVDDSGKNVVVTAPACFDPKELKERYPKSELWLARSTDGGKTFGRPVQVNEADKRAPEALHWLAVQPNGDAHVAWLDIRDVKGRGQNLYYAKVRGNKVERNRKIANQVCECCAPGITVDQKGNPIVLVREGGTSSNRAVVLLLSRNGGRSFGKPQPVNERPSGVSG